MNQGSIAPALAYSVAPASVYVVKTKRRLLLLLKEGENRRLLVQKLESKFEIVLPKPGALPLAEIDSSEFDLAILDASELQRHWVILREWRQSVEPLFLPVLALVPKNALAVMPTDMRYQIDDVVTLPVDPYELDIRISILLRSRHLSLQIHEQNQRLEEMNALKSRFVSVVSHEFRNPLSVISGIAQLLETREQRMSPEKKQDMFRRINKMVRKLIALLDELLTLSRHELNKSDFAPAPIDISLYCQSLIDNLELSSAGDTSVAQEIELRIPDDIDVVSIDTALVDTILTNLLSNAMKYSPPDGAIALTLKQTKDQLLFEVVDQGRGIPLEEQASLFDTFFRASNVGSTPGTGLGLSIVKQCVDRHQGTISVHSEVDKGTTFTVALPL